MTIMIIKYITLCKKNSLLLLVFRAPICYVIGARLRPIFKLLARLLPEFYSTPSNNYFHTTTTATVTATAAAGHNNNNKINNNNNNNNNKNNKLY